MSDNQHKAEMINYIREVVEDVLGSFDHKVNDLHAAFNERAMTDSDREEIIRVLSIMRPRREVAENLLADPKILRAHIEKNYGDASDSVQKFLQAFQLRLRSGNPIRNYDCHAKQGSTWDLICNESDLLTRELEAIKLNETGEEASLENFSLTNILRKAGIVDGKRSEGMRPARQWVQLLCTLELTTPEAAAEAYHYVFGERIQVSKLSDEDLEFATEPPASFYRVKPLVPQQSVEKPATIVRRHYRRAPGEIDTGGEPSKIALDTPTCMLPLRPDMQKTPGDNDALFVKSPAALEIDPDNVKMRSKKADGTRTSSQIYAKSDKPLFDRSRHVRKHFSDRGVLNIDYLFDPRGR